MKQLFTLLVVFLSSSLAFAQRTVDLDVKILSPSGTFAVDTNETFDLEILISNLGPDAVTMDDSLYFYMTISGDTVQFPPQGNFEIFQADIPAGSSETTMKTMVFNSSYEGLSANLCVSYRPRNAAAPISDPASGNNVSCIEVAIGEQPTTGLGEQQTAYVSIFPNPATDVLSVQSDSGILSVTVIDPSGKPVEANYGPGGVVDCSQLSAGIYYILVETGSGKATAKFAVSRN